MFSLAAPRELFFFSLAILVAAVSAPAALEPLPAESRIQSGSGKYIYLIVGVPAGKQFFSVQSIGIQGQEAYRGKALLELVDAVKGQAYPLMKSDGVTVRGIGGKQKAAVLFRLPAPAGGQNAVVEITGPLNETTALAVQLGAGPGELTGTTLELEPGGSAADGKLVIQQASVARESCR
jgi:hypothetical protein